MNLTRRCLTQLLLLLLVLAVLGPPVAAGKGETEKGDAAPPVVIERWWVLGPASHPAPGLLPEGDEPEPAGMLGDAPFTRDWPRPAEGREVAWFGGEPLRWETAEAGKRGEVTLSLPEGAMEGTPTLAVLATRVTLDRFAKVALVLKGSDVRCAWIDGNSVVDCAGGPGEDDGDKKSKKKDKKKSEDEEETRGEVELAPGTHMLVVQTVRNAGADGNWGVGAEIVPVDEDAEVRIRLDLETWDLGIREIVEAPKISSVALAPDGGRVVLGYSRYVPGTDESERWIEIRDVPRGQTVAAWRQPSAGSVDWSADGRYISWIAKGKDESSLYLQDQENGRSFPLLDDVEGLGGYLWSPNSRVIVYWATEEAEKDERGVKRVESLMDRWSHFRDKQFLHLVTVPDGVTRRLTAGEITTTASAFSPDGGRLLFQRAVEDLAQRPYYRTELWEIDLATFETTKVRDWQFLYDASYAPDGKRLLIQGPPEEFEEAGLVLPEGVIPNSYDQQLFIWNPGSGKVQAITRDFDPSVVEARWNRQDGRIYLIAEEGDRRTFYRYDEKSGRFEELTTGLEQLNYFALAEDAPMAIMVGSSAWEPQSLVALDLRAGLARPVRHPADGFFDGVRRGSLEAWNFTASHGGTIEGRVYLPPDFDAERKYPCIVYYYGGTSPVNRSFGGRYPKEWWAARGYVVYVPQPSGATGFGQPFSALHVNDWGKTTSAEVIEGTQKFLEAHPYVDPSRVGCIGASYGGFLTMLLATQTDVFAAAVSHAGISSISSYWGEGYWGYTYNAISAAESFPWNRPDLYVQQSPLFRADQARVPILLTHGADDTNVPVGESDAFFIALKLLGKEVEYVQVEGTDHWLVDHDKRILWSKTIVAWFDRWLKDQPGWWDHLYPEDE